MRRFLQIVTEAVLREGYYDPSAIYLHGGPKALEGDALKRYGKMGSDMGGLFFSKDTPNDRRYAVSYTFHHQDGGTVYKVRIKLSPDQVFDLTNRKHRQRLQAVLSPEEWNYILESARGGQMDWAVVDEDQLGEAGFKGVILAERPPNFAGNADYIYSVAVFDANVVEIVGQLSPDEIKMATAQLHGRST